MAIRVHGNHTTPDADVLALAGVAVGAPVTDALESTVKERLDSSGRFARVDVRRRYTSIADQNAVLLVIVVEERAGIAIDVPDPGPLRRLRASTMWQPVLNREDGYGFTYGVRLAFVDLLGERTRISTPFTWGGERRAAVELERRFEAGPLTRVIGSVGITRREHPALDIGDRRTEAAVRAERQLSSWAHVGATGAVADISFGGAPETLKRLGADIAVDTRRDPAVPRNAIHARFGVEHLWFDTATSATRFTTDLRGYVGLFGQAVLAVRGLQIHSSDSLPVFEQALLGGTASLRGFRLGHRFDDRLAAASVELRVPLSSPLKLGGFGLAAFADAGTVYGADEKLRDTRWDRGVGGGIFFQAPLFIFRVDVARGIGASTRAHVTLGVTM